MWHCGAPSQQRKSRAHMGSDEKFGGKGNAKNSEFRTWVVCFSALFCFLGDYELWTMLKHQMVYCVQPFLGGKEICGSWQNIYELKNTEVNTSVVNNTGTDKRGDNTIWKVIQRASNIDKSAFVVFVVLHATARLSPISLLKPPFPPECVLVFSQHRSPSVARAALVCFWLSLIMS